MRTVFNVLLSSLGLDLDCCSSFEQFYFFLSRFVEKTPICWSCYAITYPMNNATSFSQPRLVPIQSKTWSTEWVLSRRSMLLLFMPSLAMTLFPELVPLTMGNYFKHFVMHHPSFINNSMSSLTPHHLMNLSATLEENYFSSSMVPRCRALAKLDTMCTPSKLLLEFLVRKSCHQLKDLLMNILYVPIYSSKIGLSSKA